MGLDDKTSVLAMSAASALSAATVLQHHASELVSVAGTMLAGFCRANSKSIMLPRFGSVFSRVKVCMCELSRHSVDPLASTEWACPAG